MRCLFAICALFSLVSVGRAGLCDEVGGGDEKVFKSGYAHYEYYPAHGVQRLVFDPSGQRLASFADDGFKIWDVASQRMVAQTPKVLLKDMRFVNDGKVLVGLGYDVHFWSIPDDGDRVAMTSRVDKINGTLNAFDVSPDGRWLFFASNQHDFGHVASLYALPGLTPHYGFGTTRMTAAIFSHDSQQIVGMYEPKSLKGGRALQVFDLGGKMVRALGPTRHTYHEYVHPSYDRKSMIVRRDGTNEWISVDDGKPIKPFPADAPTSNIRFIRDRDPVIAGFHKDRPGELIFYNLESDRSYAIPQAGFGTLKSLAISSDARMAAVGDRSGVISLWCIRTRQRLAFLIDETIKFKRTDLYMVYQREDKKYAATRDFNAIPSGVQVFGRMMCSPGPDGLISKSKIENRSGSGGSYYILVPW